MRVRVMRGDTEIGRSRLEGQDPGMLVAWGDFEPGPGYPQVEGLFRSMSEQLHQGQSPTALFAERDGLQLTLLDEDGSLRAAEWIMIYDYGHKIGRQLETKLFEAIPVRKKTPE